MKSSSGTMCCVCSFSEPLCSLLTVTLWKTQVLLPSAHQDQHLQMWPSCRTSCCAWGSFLLSGCSVGSVPCKLVTSCSSTTKLWKHCMESVLSTTAHRILVYKLDISRCSQEVRLTPDLLCPLTSGSPSSRYWKEVAEERRKALYEVLQENEKVPTQRYLTASSLAIVFLF